MDSKDQNRYEILKDLAVASARGETPEQTARTALSQASELVGLTAAAMYLWDEQKKVTLSVSYSDSGKSADKLKSLEDDLFGKLRQEKDLLAAYMSFGGDVPSHSFTLPLRRGQQVFGAVIGYQEGERTIVSEDVFLDALCAAIAISVLASGQNQAPSQEFLDKSRLEAIVETAVTVNHEVNNPLTAILGNVQLLLMKREEMDSDLRRKLEIIEQSAVKIKDVTQKLLRLTTARSVNYANNTNMIDISNDKPKDDKDRD
jgi:K+-sensing histidine kinase KdpD